MTDWKKISDMNMTGVHLLVQDKTVSITIDGEERKAVLGIEILDMEYLTGENFEEPFNVDIFAILHPSEWGLEDNFYDVVKDEYGSAILWSRSGSDWEKLLDKAKEESYGVEHLIGFYLDKIQNGIGSTGWELILGDYKSAMDRLTH